jgi:hypothetical protein
VTRTGPPCGAVGPLRSGCKSSTMLKLENTALVLPKDHHGISRLTHQKCNLKIYKGKNICSIIYNV